METPEVTEGGHGDNQLETPEVLTPEDQPQKVENHVQEG